MEKKLLGSIAVLCAAGLGLPSLLYADTVPALTIGANFTAGTSSDSGYLPPDTNGAVGTNDIVEMVNGFYAVYPKISSGNSNSPLVSEGLVTFWNNAIANSGGSSPFTTGGSTVSNFASDPHTIYDPVSQRWYASAITVPISATGQVTQTNNLLVAVSNSSDPTGSWTGFAINSVSGGTGVTTQNGGFSSSTLFADFPTLGVNSQGVYMAANMFTVPNRHNSQSTAAAVDALVIPKSSLTGGTPSINGATLFSNQNYSTYGFTNQPVNDISGNNNPTYLFSAYDQSSSPVQNLNQTTITSATSPTLNSNYNLAAFSYQSGQPNPAPQPTAGQSLDTGDDRISSSLVMVNGNIWGVQTVQNQSNSALTALRWFRVTPATNDGGTPTINEQGIISDPNNSLFYGSIAVNAKGDIVIAFNESGSSQDASVYALSGYFDGTSTLFGATPLLLQAGLASYSADPVSGASRWGDYSTTVVDPSNPNNFWTFQEYPNGSGSWATQITEMSVPEPATLGLLLPAVMGALLLRRWRRAGM